MGIAAQRPPGDGYDQDGQREWSELRADYGDSYVRYRGDRVRLTVGAQTVIWGRMDEVPLSDRVSTADLTRLVLDKLEDRRRANPMVRAEMNVGEGKLDVVWLADFRPAELPDKDSIWYPIDRVNGRIIGVSRTDIAPAAVKAAGIVEDEPDGDGGFGVRYTDSPFFGDIGITVANTRRSIPYYRVSGADFRTVYPRSWAFGAARPWTRWVRPGGQRWSTARTTRLPGVMRPSATPPPRVSTGGSGSRCIPAMVMPV